MNIERQYKLYRLGVDIPPTSLAPIKFVEGVLSKLTFAKSDLQPKDDFYIDFNDHNKVYIHDRKDGSLLCRWDGFWEILEMEYKLLTGDQQYLVRMMTALKFGLDNPIPYCNLRSIEIEEWKHISEKSFWTKIEI